MLEQVELDFGELYGLSNKIVTKQTETSMSNGILSEVGQSEMYVHHIRYTYQLSCVYSVKLVDLYRGENTESLYKVTQLSKSHTERTLLVVHKSGEMCVSYLNLV